MAKPINAQLNRVWDTGFTHTSEGIKIRWSLYKNPHQKISKFLIFLNGRTEWIEKYAFLPADLDLSEDSAFLTIDHRGQGASDGRPGYIDSYDTYAKDVKEVIDSLVKDNAYGFLTHSMGGLIALSGTIKKIFKPKFLILTAPLIHLPEKPLPKIIARPLSKILNYIFLKNLPIPSSKEEEEFRDNNPLTHWPYGLKNIRHSPYPLNYVTPSWIKATFLASDSIFSIDGVKSLTMPVFIISPENEMVVDKNGAKKWMQFCHENGKKIDSLTIPKAKHEILNERLDIRQSACKEIRAFLNHNF